MDKLIVGLRNIKYLKQEYLACNKNNCISYGKENIWNVQQGGTMKRKQKVKISVVSMLLLCLLFVITIVYVYLQAHNMEENQIQEKTKNYEELRYITAKNATIFFGDSITERCPLEDLYGAYANQTQTSIINRGISSEKTDTMLDRLDHTVLVLKPKNLVMLMGVNDFFEGVDKETIVSNIKQMIQRTKQESPSTNILLQSIYPINKQVRNSLFERIQGMGKDNEDIKDINKDLKQLAKEECIIYVDVYNLLIDEEGNLKETYAYDGLHPNTQGYLAIRDTIIHYLK